MGQPIKNFRCEKQLTLPYMSYFTNLNEDDYAAGVLDLFPSRL